MIVAKQGPKFPGCNLQDQLAASVWLHSRDGKNSEGERVPDELELDRAHVWLEFVLLEQGRRR